MLAMKPTPQESFSSAGSNSPCAGGYPISTRCSCDRLSTIGGSRLASCPRVLGCLALIVVSSTALPLPAWGLGAGGASTTSSDASAADLKFLHHLPQTRPGLQIEKRH